MNESVEWLINDAMHFDEDAQIKISEFFGFIF